MKRQITIFLISFFWTKALLFGASLDLNTSYDYFRGLPDGSWNGNSGMLVAANSGITLFDCLELQAGGSYGLYNWDGRNNLVFANTKALQQIGFITAGASSSYCGWSAGVVYDRLLTRHFGIYDLNPSIDQLRLQTGYSFCSDEVGIWGTLDLSTDHKFALGIPVAFKAIGQANLFWSHFFDNCSQTTLWIGTPYRHSLMFQHERAGNIILGFSVRVPLTEQLFLDGNGSYMSARKSYGAAQDRNYGSSICIGLTYNFNRCEFESPYMPIANHSNFFVDTDTNQ